jgi:sugar phosphate isomerase/epimerase
VLLGYNTNGFSSHRLDDAIDVIAGLGYRSVAITLDHDALDPFGENLRADVKRVRKRVETLGLTPVVETGARFLLDPWRKHFPTLLDPDPARRGRRLDFLLRAVAIARDLGAGVVSLWSGAAPAGGTLDPLMPRLIDGLAEVCDAAQAAGVRVGLEPEPGMFVESMADYEATRDNLGHAALGLTLDIGHAHLSEASGAEATARRFVAETINVHVEGMSRKLGHVHLPPSEGDLSVRGVVRALIDERYAGPATLELSRHGHDAVRIAAAAARFLAPLGLLAHEPPPGT